LWAVIAGGAGDVAGESAAVGAFGFGLGFSAFGAFAFGLGECAGRGELCLAAVAEAVTFTGGVGAGLGCLVAGVGFGLAGSADLSIGAVLGLGSGGLLTGAIGDGGDLRGGVAAQLGELARRGAGAVGCILRGCAGGGGVVTGGFGFGDLGADGGRILAGGLLCRSACVHDGLKGTRSGLWHYVTRCLTQLRPAAAYLENVAALRTRGLSRVVADLARLGYDTQWATVRASSAGAPHARARLFILAVRSGHAVDLVAAARSDRF
jgi:C-5 cytosine-specific DNA methylase